VSEFILNNNAVPINPFRLFDYFLGDRVDRNIIRQANNNCVRIADEIWVFGDISNGVFHEIQYARSLNKSIKFFSINSYAKEIISVHEDTVIMENELIKELKEY